VHVHEAQEQQQQRDASGVHVRAKQVDHGRSLLPLLALARRRATAAAAGATLAGWERVHSCCWCAGLRSHKLKEPWVGEGGGGSEEEVDDEDEA